MKKSLITKMLVLGGASSGKSLWAEHRVVETQTPRIYIATSQAWDDEIRARIAAHKAQRGPNWHTVEAPIDLASAIMNAPENSAVLVDCLTMWLTNLMIADHNIDAAIDATLTALSQRTAPTVFVSNDVGQGIIPNNKMARKFIGIQGRANQHFASACDQVAFVTAGLPSFLKGSL